MKHLIQILFFVSIVFYSNDIIAQIYKTESGKVEFLSKAPLYEFIGSSNKLSGLIDLENQTFDFFIDLNTLKTGIGLRDKHMRDNYLETKKYPFAEFVGNLEQINSEMQGKNTNIKANGKFKIHGVEKQVNIFGNIKQINQSEIKVEAQFTIKMTDYKIDIPKLVFYELTETQEITINILLKRQSP